MPDFIKLGRSGACRHDWGLVSLLCRAARRAVSWALQGTQDPRVIWVGVLLGDNSSSNTTYILVFLGIL